MLEKELDDIEIIDIEDDEIEIIDVEEDLISLEMEASSEDDLLNEVDSNHFEESSKEEKGFSHVLLYSFLGGFTGGILLTIVLHLTHIL